MREYGSGRKNQVMNDLYWVWLALKDEIKPREIVELTSHFRDIKELYKKSDRKDFENFSEETINALMDKSLDDANKVIAKIQNMGGYILTLDDDNYPSLLRNIYDPPIVLYLLGQRLDWDNLLTVTIVGSRKYNSYGRTVTSEIAGSLAGSGAVVVSGMALGIDSIANRAALDMGAKTVAVLGSGLDVIYPPSNTNLYWDIVKNGVVMTEYPPGTRPLAQNFPRRNRIMAGLSYGVLVTQAPEKSGALITASCALESGRDVFAVPANITMYESVGTNRLLTAGAKAVIDASDILSEYGHITLTDEKNDKKTAKIPEDVDTTGLSEVQVKIIYQLSGTPRLIDEISRSTGIQSSVIGSELVMLELLDKVEKTDNNSYRLK